LESVCTTKMSSSSGGIADNITLTSNSKPALEKEIILDNHHNRALRSIPTSKGVQIDGGNGIHKTFSDWVRSRNRRKKWLLSLNSAELAHLKSRLDQFNVAYAKQGHQRNIKRPSQPSEPPILTAFLRPLTPARRSKSRPVFADRLRLHARDRSKDSQ